MSWITRARLSREAPAQRALAALLLAEGARDVGHRLVWTLFADDPDARRDFVYREAEPGRFLVVSHREPTNVQGLWDMETKPYDPQFAPGRRLGFAARINPAQSVKAPSVDRGRRVDAVMHAKTLAADPLGPDEIERAALDWLFAREARLGVRFDRPLCAAGGYRQVRIARGGGDPIRHSVVDYEGALEVVDPAALAMAAIEGVGKSRAFGCGLLMLRPLPV